MDFHIASACLSKSEDRSPGGAGASPSSNPSKPCATRRERLVYGLLGVAGFVAPGLVARALGHDGPLTAQALMADNLVQIVLGAAAGIVAIVGSATRSLPLDGLSRQVR